MSDPSIVEAAERLEAGELVVMPTETVYGLAADAENLKAIAKVFELKQRPARHPLIVHLAHFSEIPDWAAEVPPVARLLARCFWPGPLTLVLPKKKGVSDLITGGRDTIALRIPEHPMAQSLLSTFGRAVVAPSANRFGGVSPTMPSHVREDFKDECPMILDAGACPLGIESTIVEVLSSGARLLRKGAVSRYALEEIIREGLIDDSGSSEGEVPGQLSSHYAPKTPLYYTDRHTMVDLLKYDTDRPVAVLTASRFLIPLAPNQRWIPLPSQARRATRQWYALLRDLDSIGFKAIYIPKLSDEDEDWEALEDRVIRASSPLPEKSA